MEKAIELAPEHHHALFNLAQVLDKLGELRPALNTYQKILAAPPDDGLGPEFVTAIMAAIGELMSKITGQGQ